MPTVLKSGSLNLLEPSSTVHVCNGIPLPLQVCLCIKQAPNYDIIIIIIIIIIIGTTAPFEPRSSSEASANCPYFLQHSSQFLSPNFLASSITPTTATRTLLVALCSSIRITCPAHFNQLILMYVTISVPLYNVYSSLFYFILRCHL